MQAEKAAARDYITGLLAIAGVVLLCCEGETLAGQVLAALSGFALWGLAAVVWIFWDRLASLVKLMAQTAAAAVGLLFVKTGLAIWKKSGTKVTWNLNCKEVIIRMKKQKAPSDLEDAQPQI